MEQVRQAEGRKPETPCAAREVIDNTIRIARLKLLFIAAKITSHSNTYEVKYSEHDSRVSGLFQFVMYLDERIQPIRPWLDSFQDTPQCWEYSKFLFLSNVGARNFLHVVTDMSKKRCF